jgi:hypothetical protein
MSHIKKSTATEITLGCWKMTDILYVHQTRSYHHTRQKSENIMSLCSCIHSSWFLTLTLALGIVDFLFVVAMV